MDMLRKKYGTELFYKIDNALPHKYLYQVSGISFSALSGGQYNPGIQVRIEDREYYDRLHDKLLDELIPKARARIKAVPKPQF
jgi:hypothetical protein